jgi:hypothetical protein
VRRSASPPSSGSTIIGPVAALRASES